MDSGAWLALIALASTVVTVIGTAVNNWLSTKPQLQALKDKDESQQRELEVLKKEYVACQEAHRETTDYLNTPWPSDHEPMIGVMQLLKQHGLPHTFGRDQVFSAA